MAEPAASAEIVPETAGAASTVLAHRFETDEIAEFASVDAQAGRFLGKLLAGLFFVLLILMLGATVWTMSNQNLSDDPHAVAPDHANP